MRQSSLRVFSLPTRHLVRSFALSPQRPCSTFPSSSKRPSRVASAGRAAIPRAPFVTYHRSLAPPKLPHINRGFLIKPPLQSSASGALVPLALAAVAAALYFALQPNTSAGPPQEDIVAMPEIVVTPELPPGRPGNLTPDQEEHLRQLWAAIFRVCGVNDADDASSISTPSIPNVLGDKINQTAEEKPKKRRITLFSRKGHKENASEPTTPGAIKTDDAEDKYGQNKEYYDTLANQTPESIRATIWSMVKHDHPDALVLRFLRARKWDVEKALVMLVSTMNWRANEMHVDDDIMKNGEGGAVELETSSDAKVKQLNRDFMAQIRMGKSFLHGVDDKGRPICVVKVRLHHQGEHCEESVEKNTVFIIETARMLLRPPVDTATIIFDMTGFSMANMDYTPVKFMIKCFEANYPECLGSVLVHKAPWIFQGIWKIIKGWLDPVVASKVHFTNSLKDMEEYIAPSRVMKELDGEENWQYKYMEPVPGENDKMKDAETRTQLLAAREHLYKEYEELTLKWIHNPEDSGIKPQREAVAAKLRADYWNLDPYVRARTFYDRIGVIQGDKVEPYSKAAPAPAVNGTAAVLETPTAAAAATPAPAAAQGTEHSADDVD